MTDHLAVLEGLLADAGEPDLRMSTDEKDAIRAAIALMRGQSEDRPRDAIDDDNGFRRYPWTYQNQPGNVGAWALGESASKAKPGGDPIDHGLSLLRELHLRGLGIVRVTKLKDTADEQ